MSSTGSTSPRPIRSAQTRLTNTGEKYGTTVGVDQLLYLGVNRRSLHLRSAQGGRMIMLGGQPFAEDIVMWWNFIGRSHQEIVEFRSAWERRDSRFPPIVSRSEKVMEAPPMPTVQLKPRPRRSRSE